MARRGKLGAKAEAKLAYAAEAEVRWPAVGYSDIADVRAEVKRIVKTPWFKAQYPGLKSVSVRTSEQNSSSARGGLYQAKGELYAGIRFRRAGAIQSGSWHWDKYGYARFKRESNGAVATTLDTVLHELAHAATMWVGGTAYDGHGPHWRRSYVNLVTKFIGKAEAAELVERFEARGLPVATAAEHKRAVKAALAEPRPFVRGRY